MDKADVTLSILKADLPLKELYGKYKKLEDEIYEYINSEDHLALMVNTYLGSIDMELKLLNEIVEALTTLLEYLETNYGTDAIVRANFIDVIAAELKAYQDIIVYTENKKTKWLTEH